MLLSGNICPASFGVSNPHLYMDVVSNRQTEVRTTYLCEEDLEMPSSMYTLSRMNALINHQLS